MHLCEALSLTVERIEFRPKQLLRNSHIRTMLLAAAIAPSYHAPSSDTLAPPSNHVKSIGGSLDVAQALRCDALASRADSIALHGSLENAGDLSADRVDAGSVAASSASVSRLETAGTVRVTGAMSVAGAVEGAANTSCADALSVGGGSGPPSSCRPSTARARRTAGPAARAPLAAATASPPRRDGGGRRGAAAADARRRRLPAHTSLEVRASYLFVDAWRAGDAGYALVDGQPVWLDHHEAPLAGGGGVDLCGGPTPRRARLPIRASVAHAATSANLTFAATVGCEGSFAVDDVEVRVR